MSSWLVLIAALAAPLLYLLVARQFSYWKRRGVAQLGPIFPFGNLGPFFRQRSCLGVTYAELYHRWKALPFVGIYFSLRPLLLINDPELIKNVLTRDFEYFHDRGLHVNEEKDPLSGHLFALGGDKWRHHRSKLTPTFTSGRLKEMFQNLVEIGQVLQEYVGKRAAAGEEVDVRELMARYTTDVIASVGFGIENDSINDSDNMFRKMGTKVFAQDIKTIVRLASTFFLPKLNALFNFKFIAQDIEDFMMNVVRETLEYRESNNVVRKDIMQLLMQLRNTGTVSMDKIWKVEAATPSAKQLSLEQVTAHAFVFFAAGYETSSSTISFCLFELARNVDIQRKLQAEIDQVLAKHNGAITYDSINEMKYLENCIDETLRKYPAVPFLNRECTKDYVIPGTSSTVEKGTTVIIPVLGLQHDPEFYSDPEKFIPERFTDEATTDKPYLPFGTGPRVCIGLRLGKLQTKMGLVMMLSKFNIRLVDETYYSKELELDSKGLFLMPIGGIKVAVSARSD
ncbi:probable cytochrome P450 6d5 [Culex pipiens pallens]|uniref:probable cytochrome P450 6d5 n=1 Tax=Culex pipiens pallens TaxID=42434 RepID=UPI001954006A|nr:probable cytochrome P450 6d5 [Culex pipiens pallens]